MNTTNSYKSKGKKHPLLDHIPEKLSSSMAREANSEEKPQSDYQVFLSFRGCDSQQGFTDCLYHSLTDAGVRVFRDNEELRPADKIEEVVNVINKSIVCIPILSRNYANSKWCLFELSKMVELKKDIMPIFYEVEADDVKLKTKLYSEHLSRFGEQYNAERAEWEGALKEVGGIFDKSQLEGTFEEVGRIRAWTIMDYPSYGKLCKEVVREVLHKLEVKHKIVDSSVVGIDDHVDDMRKLLDIESPDVRYVVIHGVAGVGKTTLAKSIFNQLCDRRGGFDHCCFLDNVRETANHQGIVYLQKNFLRELGQGRNKINNSDSGIKTIKDVIKNKKVMIILDDLDQRKQMESLAGDHNWFGSGSRVIITTRDPTCVANHPKVWYYNMTEMSSDCALKLFCSHAVDKEPPPADYLDISKEAVAACGRLPLVLKVMGSYLRDIDKGFWKSKIEMIASHKDVQEKLMISYKALDPRTKEIFLDIACFFVGVEKFSPIHMWEASDLHPDEGIQHLLSMSLVKISPTNTFLMHDLLRDLGREIVVQENLRRSEKRSRLWSQKEVERVLSREKGTRETNGLRVTRNSDSDGGILHNTVTANQIRHLQNLRFLELDRVHMQGDFENALQDLKWFSWKNMGDSRVINLVLKDLVVLELSNDDLSDEWLSTIEIGENLKALKLAFTSAPKSDGPMGFTKLQEILKNSSSLAELEISSPQLTMVPYSIGKLKNLRVMNLTNSSVSALPPFIGDLEKLEELHVATRTLEDIPEEIERLRQLRVLNLNNSNITRLPSKIHELPLLQLNLEDCHSIQELPKLPSTLTILRVKSDSLTKLPNLSNLEHLTVLFFYGNCFYPTLLEHHLTGNNQDWIKKCPSLESLQLGFKGIISMEMESCAFPSLKKLELNCLDLKVVRQLPLNLTSLKLRANAAGTTLSTCLEEMEALNDLELLHTKFVGELPLPRNLKTLHILKCHFSQPSLNLSGLKMLRYLKINGCEDLTAIRGIENMKFSMEIIVKNCLSLREISDLSKFKQLSDKSHNPAIFEGIGGITATVTTIDSPKGDWSGNVI